VVSEVRCRFDHPPRGAGRADATPFAGVGDDRIVTAVRAAGSGETVGEDAAFEVAAEFAFGQCRGMAATAAVVQRQPGGEVRLDDAVENCAFGLAPVVNGRRTARFGGSGRHGYPDRGIG
jgi:hypothetical protein